MIGRQVLLVVGAALALAVLPSAHAEPDDFFTDVYGRNTALGNDLSELFSGQGDFSTVRSVGFDLFVYDIVDHNLPAGIAGLFGNTGGFEGVFDSDAHTAVGLAMFAAAIFPGMGDQTYSDLAVLSAQYLSISTSDLLADLSQGFDLADGEVYGAGARFVEALMPADVFGPLTSVAMDLGQYLDGL